MKSSPSWFRSQRLCVLTVRSETRVQILSYNINERPQNTSGSSASLSFPRARAAAAGRAEGRQVESRKSWQNIFFYFSPVSRVIKTLFIARKTETNPCCPLRASVAALLLFIFFPGEMFLFKGEKLSRTFL